MAFLWDQAQIDRVERKLDALLNLAAGHTSTLSDIQVRVKSADARMEHMMSNQERANEIAANIAEDTEVIAKAVDSLTAAVANERAAREAVEAQLEQANVDLAAAGVDFTELHAAEAKVDELAGVLNAALSPSEPTPALEEVPTVEPVAETSEPVSEAPAEAPAETGESSEPVTEPGPVDVGEVSEPVTEAPAVDDSAPLVAPSPDESTSEVPPVETAPGEEPPASDTSSDSSSEGGSTPTV